MSKKYFAMTAALLLTLVVSLVSEPALAQRQRRPRVSPHEDVAFTFDNGKTIKIQYGRPYMKDPKTGQPRKIFGGLVPYGEVWRAGADEATSFVTDSDLIIGGTAVPAGRYTLNAIPKEGGKWTLIVSKVTGNWGIPYPGPDTDFARIDAMTVKPTTSVVEQFTIALDKAGPKGAVLKMAWENTAASIPVQQK